MMMYRKLGFLMGIALLAGCSSSSDTADEGAEQMNEGGSPGSEDQEPAVDNPIESLLVGNIMRVGAISVDEQEEFSSVNASAEFTQLSGPVTGADIANATSIVFGNCFVGLSGGGGGSASIFTLSLPTVTQTFISAGDIITLGGEGGSYGELASNNDPDFLTYVPETPLSFPAPDSLTVNIPGDEFPAFSGIEVPRPSLVTALNPEVGSTISAVDNVFTWEATGVPGSTISIRAEQVVTDPNDFRLVLGCTVADDGSFTIPGDVITRLNTDFGTEDWSMEYQSISSTVRAVRQDGDAVVLVTRTNQ